MSNGLPPVLTQTLAAFADKRRRVLAMRGLGETVLAGAAGLAVVALGDALLHPGRGLHTVLSLGAYGVASGVLVVRCLYPLLARPRLVESAHALERAAGGRLQERLSSAVELAGRPANGVSPWMIERTIVLAAQEAAALDLRTLVSTRAARRAWLRTIGLGALLAGACAVPGVPAYLARAAWPAVLRPSLVHLEVQPGDVHLAAAAALDIQVVATPDPGSASLELVWADGVVERPSLERGERAGGYRLSLPAVIRPLYYRVLAGDAESRAYRVDVVEPPRLAKIALRITPPAYSGLPARTVEGSGDAEIIVGSQVALSADLVGERAAAGAVVWDGGESAATLQGGQLRAMLAPTANLSYGLRLIGVSCIAAEPSQRWLLSVLPDRAPSAHLGGAGTAAGLVGADETLLLDAQAGDDLGLKTLELVVTVDGAERARRPLTLPAPEAPGTAPREARLAVPLALDELAVQVGETVTLVLRATDSGGQGTSSAPLTLTATAGPQAAEAAQATHLRQALHQLDAQADALRQLLRGWGAVAHAGSDDAAALRGDLRLLADRSRSFAGAVGEAAELLRAEALAGGPLAPALLALADEARAFGGGLGEQSLAAVAAAQRAPAGAQRAHDLCEAAGSDLGALRHDLALFIARLEAAGVAAGAEAGAARWQRALAILAGERGWNGDLRHTKSGLLARVWRGRDFQGEPAYREIGMPAFAERDWPVVGHDNYCVRYSGEIFIPGSADWTIVLAADDGVRLRLDGNHRDLLPESAWSQHGMSDFRARLHLDAGWHAIEIDYFQGGGNSGLNARLGERDNQLVPLTAEHLRSSTDVHSGALVAAMASLPRAQLEAGRQRLGAGLAAVAEVPGQLARIGEVSGNESVLMWARAREADATQLRAALPRLADWNLETLLKAGEQGEGIVTDAGQSRAAIATQVERELHERVRPGLLAPLRQDLARVRDRIAGLRAIPERLASQERALRLAVEGASAGGWFDQLAREAQHARAACAARARQPGSGLAHRAAALWGAHALALLAAKVEELRSQYQDVPPAPHPAADRLQNVHDQLMNLLREAERWEEAVDHQAAADIALPMQARFRELQAAQQAGGALARQRLHRELRERGRALVASARAAGEFTESAQLLAAIGAEPADCRLGELGWRLDRHAQEAQAWYDGLDRLAADQLAATADQLQRAHAATTEPVTVLGESALALMVEGERRRQVGDADLGLAFAVLGRDTAVVASAPTPPTAAVVRILAERAAALLGRKGEDARKAEIAAAKAAAPAASPADHLDALAHEAAQVDGAKRRDALAAELAPLAAQQADAKTAAPERAALAQRLAELAARVTALDAADAAARKEFAAAETKVAEAMPAAAAQAEQAAAHTADQPLAEGLHQVPKQLPAAADQAHALAGEAAAHPDPADPAARPSADLAAAGERLADQLQQQIAQPLAERFQAASASAPANANQPAAEAGKALAAVIGEQRAAAEHLAQTAAERDAARAELAAAVSEGAAVAAESPAPAPAPGAAAVPAQPGAAPAANDPKQAAADQAQAAADQAQAQAQPAATQGADARAAAARNPGDGGAKQNAQVASQNAANMQANAVAAERLALDAQAAAAASAPAGAFTPASAAQLAQAVDGLTHAVDNSVAAQANAAINPASAAETAPQADANRARAETALAASDASLTRAAGDLAAALGGAPAGVVPAAGAPAGNAAPAEAGAAAAADPAATAPPAGDPIAPAAAAALAQLGATPDPGQGGRQAAQILAAAAAQMRLAALTGAGQAHERGQDKPLAKDQGGGPEPGKGDGGDGHSDGTPTGEPGSAAGLTSASAGVDQADWAKSRAEVRAGVRSGAIEQFSEEHQEAIRAYLKRLGEEK